MHEGSTFVLSSHLTLSSGHAGAIFGRCRLLRGYGMDLVVNETAVLRVELESTFSSRAKPECEMWNVE